MQISEAELHTGFFPDSILFDKMNAEYERKDLDGKNIWDSIPQFCNAYKFNEDGIAQEIQEAANAEIRELRARAERLQNENARLSEINEDQLTELLNLSQRVDTLTKQVEKLPTATLEVAEPEITVQTIRAAIQQAYQDAAHDDCKGDQILHMVWGFEYLLQRLGVE